MKLALLIVVASFGLASPVAAGDFTYAVAAGDFTYKDWRFDTSAVHEGLSDSLVRAFQAQIDIVESLSIKPEIKSFLRAVDVKVEPSTFGAYGFYRAQRGRVSIHRVYLSTREPPADSPVLLALLLYDYLRERIRDGRDNAAIAGYFDEARHMNAFANRSTMMRNPTEFFSASAAVVMWGRAPQEPRTRAKLRKALPDFYEWLVTEFYPPGVAP